MRAKISAQVVFTGMFFLCLSFSARAITVDVQYRPGTLFYSGIDSTAKAAINAAAADISAAITTSLHAVPSDTFSGQNGSATVTFDWKANYQDPITGQEFSVPNATLAADTVTIYVGTTNLRGNPLGQGGGHFGVGIQASYNPAQPGEWVGASASAAAQSQAAYTRGAGPVIGTLTGGANFGGVSGSYSVDYGAAFGSAWFDVDEDNNGAKDTVSSLNDYWHWSHTADVASGKNDLYSVALHEMLHVLGIGVSNSWDDQVSGTTWMGTEVQAITGNGAALVNSTGDHIANSVMSSRISDGLPQEVVMDPTVTTGTRKELTALDLAFLRDIGYETIVPATPNPPDYDGDTDIDAADLATFQSAYGLNGKGDANGDSFTDGADLLVWQRKFTGPLGSTLVASVPEPSSAWLLVTGFLVTGLLLVGRRR